MRARYGQEVEASIDYLESKLQESNIAGMQQVCYQLIESETPTVMLVGNSGRLTLSKNTYLKP